ncbi:MAG: aminoacyl-tRNA hydrolase [Chloroflexota bacterium]|nr:MAG: aminoacyl-tRNA hydrolase [Chloroflexota bacterium]
MTEPYLIVGLGNPGPKYENTRHNIGFKAVDALASKHGLSFSKQEHKALVASGNILGKRVLLAKPQTYMNNSGDAVAPLMRFYKIPLEHLLVVMDDLDTPLGTLRMRPSGSSGGQNGMKHIIQRMGTQDIARLRLGISRPPGRMDPVAWVLTPFRGDDEILAAQVVDRAVLAIETWLTDGVELAMSRYNGPIDQTARKPTKPVALPLQDEGNA